MNIIKVDVLPIWSIWLLIASTYLTTTTSRDTTTTTSYSFLAIGDWGGASINQQIRDNVYSVSSQMAKIASVHKPKFILGTGDNFYWCGIQNISDKQIVTDWVEPYAASELDLNWYNILGNHEYGYNVSAQIDLGNKYPNWIMDDRYYTRRLKATTSTTISTTSTTSTYISFIFLDTSPCIQAYRSDDPDGWDPCSTEYPTCSLGSTDDDFEGTCYFNQNILTQNCTIQHEWFLTQLKNVPKNDWLIVVGHHPIDELDVEDFATPLQEHGFSIYFNGHIHALQQYTLNNKGAYVTTGAGALVNIVTKAKKKLDALRNVNSYQILYSSKTAGFNLNTFSDDFTSLYIEYISYTGETLHSFHVYKNGTLF